MGLSNKKYEPDPINERQLILENDHVTLWYYPGLDIVHHQMVEPPASEEFKELLIKGTETLGSISERSSGYPTIGATTY